MLSLDEQGFPQWRGEILKLPPKERAVLGLLIQRQPQVVSKQEFADTVWGVHHPMSDESLARCISHLRAVLAEQLQLSLKIESMYGLGYRLQVHPAVLLVPGKSIDETTTHWSSSLPESINTLRHAQQLAERRTPAALQVAVRLLRDLITKHPTDAAAHVALAKTMADAAGWSLQTDSSFVAEGLSHLDEAERIDPTIPGLLYCRAYLMDFAWRFQEAAPLWQKAMRFSVDDPKLVFLYGRHLLVIGDTERAIATLRQARELHPFSAVLRVTLARAFAQAGDFDLALKEVTATCEDHPESEIADNYRVALLALTRPDASVLTMAWRMAEQRDASPLALSIVSYLLARLDLRNQALEVIDTCLSCRDTTACTAVLHTPALLAIGETRRAINLVTNAYQARCGVLPLALRDPANVLLHQQSEIQSIMAVMFKQNPGSS